MAVDTGWSLESHRWRVSALDGIEARPQRCARGLIGISLVAWAYTGYLAWDMHHMAMTMPQMQGWGVVDLLLLYLMWAVMMVAMMVPSAAPMILMFVTINRRRREQQQPLSQRRYFLLAIYSYGPALALWRHWRNGACTLPPSCRQ